MQEQGKYTPTIKEIRVLCIMKHTDLTEKTDRELILLAISRIEELTKTVNTMIRSDRDTITYTVNGEDTVCYVDEEGGHTVDMSTFEAVLSNAWELSDSITVWETWTEELIRSATDGNCCLFEVTTGQLDPYVKEKEDNILSNWEEIVEDESMKNEFTTAREAADAVGEMIRRFAWITD